MYLVKATFCSVQIVAFAAFFAIELCSPVSAAGCVTVDLSNNTLPTCDDDVFLNDADSECNFECVCATNNNCTACQSGYFGDNCTEQALCAEGCNYSRSAGCQGSDNKTCNLYDLNTTSDQGDEVYGTIGIVNTITIAIDVNLSPSDVIVTMSVNNTGQQFELITTDDVTYAFNVTVAVNASGQYTFTATALLENGTKTNISEETQVLVTIYDPVAIADIAAVYDGDDTPKPIQDLSPAMGESLRQLICSATGIAATIMQVSWMYDGGNISYAPLQNRMYQVRNEVDEGATATLYLGDVAERTGIYTCQGVSDDNQYTFYDTRSVEWSNPDPTVYASRREFVIAASVLGAALIISIVSFAIVITCIVRRTKDDVKSPPVGMTSQAFADSPIDSTSVPKPMTAQDTPMTGAKNDRYHQHNPQRTERPVTAASSRPPVTQPAALGQQYMHATNPTTPRTRNPVENRPPMQPPMQQPANEPRRSQPPPTSNQQPIYDPVSDDAPALPPNHPTRHQQSPASIYLTPDESVYQDTM